MPKPKFYVVWVGRKPGIYSEWPAAQDQVKGFPDARFRSYPTRAEAETAYRAGYTPPEPDNEKSTRPPSRRRTKPDITTLLPAWAVDAACSGVPGPMEYRGVDLATGRQLFLKGPYPDGTNNVGEFLAIVHALALLEKAADTSTAIYTDSRTAQAWVRNKKAKTTLERTARNAGLFDLIARAEQWLKTHRPPNKILKWDTANWGEIPADFGRK